MSKEWKNSHHNLQETNVTSLNSFLCSTNSPKPKEFSFTVINNREIQQLLKYKKFEPANVLTYLLNKLLKQSINNQNSWPFQLPYGFSRQTGGDCISLSMLWWDIAILLDLVTRKTWGSLGQTVPGYTVDISTFQRKTEVEGERNVGRFELLLRN